MTKLTLIPSYLMMFLVIVTCQNLQLNEPCKSIANTEGRCIIIQSCPAVIELIRMKDYESARNLSCGYEKKNIKVCCPLPLNESTIVFSDSTETATRGPTRPSSLLSDEKQVAKKTSVEDLLPDRLHCGLDNNNDRIIGGINTDIDEFPWLARLKYIVGKINTQTYCSASLISNRYLLTAAHCVKVNNAELVSVILGDWDTQTEIDCVDTDTRDKDCNDKPVEIKIEKIIPYPNFTRNNPAEGDIALIRLERPVEFTDFIQPVCLPTTEFVTLQDYVQHISYMTAGWGVTEYGSVSPIKRKVKLNAVPTEYCKGLYPKYPESAFQKLICAGGTLGKDSCKGDSGGPLTRLVSENNHRNWFLFGITSFGIINCGTEGFPGIYTRVTSYMDWIKNNIEP